MMLTKQERNKAMAIIFPDYCPQQYDVAMERFAKAQRGQDKPDVGNWVAYRHDWPSRDLLDVKRMRGTAREVTQAVVPDGWSFTWPPVNDRCVVMDDKDCVVNYVLVERGHETV